MYAIERSLASQVMRQSQQGAREMGWCWGMFPAVPEDAQFSIVCSGLCLLKNIPSIGDNEEEKFISYQL